MRKRFFVSLIFLFLSFGFLLAQTSFTTKVSATHIGKNETLEVSYEVQNTEIEDLAVPVFKGFKIFSGPSFGNTIIESNGQQTTSYTYNYILQPLGPGSYIIPGARGTIAGKAVASNSVAVTVENREVPNTASASAGPSMASLLNDLFPPQQSQPVERDNDGYILKQNEDPEKKTRSNLFILVNVSKKECYEGEGITATYQLYSRVSMNAHITKRPSFSGFTSVDLADNMQGESQIQEYKGKVYRVYNIRRVQLYPLQRGLQTLEPAEIDATVEYRKLYDPYGQPVSFTYTIHSEPLQVNVLPLPTPKPAGFTGVVGNFDIKAAFKNDQLDRRQAGKLLVEITGEGNWPMVQPPIVSWPAHVEVFEPAITENLDSQSTPIKGKRIYEYSFSTDSSGTLTIPDIHFSYFNVAAKKYETKVVPPLSLQVSNTVFKADVPDNFDRGSMDFTKIFTDLVTIVFPIAALLLLAYVVAKNVRKKKQLHDLEWQNQYWMNKRLEENYRQQMAKRKEANEAIHTPEQNAYDTYMPAFQRQAEQAAVNDETTETIGEEAKEERPVEYQILPAKQYFTSVKKEVLTLLQTRMNILAQEISAIGKALAAKGMDATDVEQITTLLETCNRHIYSPFAENINTALIADDVAQIKGLIKL